MAVGWEEILRDLLNLLNGKLTIVQNRKKTDTDSEDDDDDDDVNEEMPETTGKPTYDTSEHNGRYAMI